MSCISGGGEVTITAPIIRVSGRNSARLPTGITATIRPLAKVRADNVCAGFSRARSWRGKKIGIEEARGYKEESIRESVKFERNGAKKAELSDSEV